MRNFLLLASFFIIGLAILFVVFSQTDTNNQFINPLTSPESESETGSNKDLPLNKYTFANLAATDFKVSQIIKEKIISDEEGYTSYLFSYQVEGKKVTGMLNLSDNPQTQLPAVILLRGYADDSIYFTGLGTRKAAGVLAQNGFITLAPDFLGFGGSDAAAADILEARFYRPVTVLALLKAVENFAPVDPNKIFLWGHSNGGQIALSVLEITQRNLPTVLWAPVTADFPECVLYYMGELDDQGRKVKAAIEDFDENYNGRDFSVDAHLDLINAPIQLHQGGRDPLIPERWTDDFLNQMKELNKEIDYHFYPQADHNLVPDWDGVMAETVSFFKSF